MKLGGTLAQEAAPTHSADLWGQAPLVLAPLVLALLVLALPLAGQWLPPLLLRLLLRHPRRTDFPWDLDHGDEVLRPEAQVLLCP